MHLSYSSGVFLSLECLTVCVCPVQVTHNVMLMMSKRLYVHTNTQLEFFLS